MAIVAQAVADREGAEAVEAVEQAPTLLADAMTQEMTV